MKKFLCACWYVREMYKQHGTRIEITTLSGNGFQTWIKNPKPSYKTKRKLVIEEMKRYR